jgi:hypothetical protein
MNDREDSRCAANLGPNPFQLCLAGKVVRSLRIFEDGNDGPEVSIDFEDGSNFNACLGVKMTLEAKWTRDDGGQPQMLKDYTTPAVPR